MTSHMTTPQEFPPEPPQPKVPPGWYPDPDNTGRQRYFDGAAWAEHRPVPKDGYSTAERSEILEQVLVSQHAQVVTRTPVTAAVVIGQPVNHILHLLLSVLTCGLWIPLWIIMAYTGGQKHFTLSVDPKGQVHWTGPGGAAAVVPAGFKQPVATGKNAIGTDELIEQLNPIGNFKCFKCFKCGKSQAVATTTPRWVCKHCGQKLKRQGGGGV